MEILEDEIRQAKQRYHAFNNQESLMYLKGLEVAWAIMNGEMD
jgi:hypothetical protein